MLRGENLMATKRKFKRDYIMLEAKDLNYRYKDKASPKAFVKIEVTDDKSVVALYAENLKSVSEGYSVVAIRSDYETIDLGTFNVNSQGKGEFSIDMGEEDIDIKGVAVVQDKAVPLIGFKGNKIDNYEDILFPPQYEFDDVDDEDYVDDTEDYDDYDDNNIDIDDEYEEYEEIEYIEVEEDDIDDERDNIDNVEEYEEIEYLEPDEINEYEEIIYEEVYDVGREYEREYEYEYIEDDNEEEYEYIEVEEDYESREQPKKVEETKQSRIKNEDEYIDKKIKKAKSVLGKQYTNIGNKNNKETIKTTSTLLMPRQIKKGLKYFREVKPFVGDYIDNTRWWKIEINPTTMCGYTMPYLGYVNTLNYTMYSDAVMQSYKYRHYLFGVQYDDYNKRQYYIYAVPGRKTEQPDKGHTGFTRYQPCDTRNNSLGYWLCFVDCKARKIVK